MATDFIRIPPDSTGKKIRHTERYDIILTNILIDLNKLEVGDTITGKTSGATGKYVGTQTELGSTYVYIADDIGTFQQGEVLSEAGLGDIGTISQFVNVYTPTVHLADPNTPFNRQRVDDAGSAFVRFNEGNINFDAYGNAQFTQITPIGFHNFAYVDEPQRYYDILLSGGGISHDPESSVLTLSTNTSSGSRACRTSNDYYSYTPGVGTEVIFSIASGDAGKAGVVRRWGFYDDNDGIFFEQSGSNLFFVRRTSATGTIQDIRVAQEDATGDPLLNPNTAEFVLDVSKFNMYWIDYTWHGTGRIRLGTFKPNGKRITMHTFEYPNTADFPHTKYGTHPIRVECFNETTTASTSELKLLSATVFKQSENEQFFGNTYFYSKDEVVISGSEFTPMISARPKQTFNGLINHVTIIPEQVEFIVDGDPVKLRVFLNGTLTGETFTEVASPFSTAEIDDTATAISGGVIFDEALLGTGPTVRELEPKLSRALSLGADNTTVPIITFSAKSLRTNGNAKVSALIKWKEVK